MGIEVNVDIHIERTMVLDPLAQELVEKRTEAVDYRRNSGVEEIWREDEEMYEGIDGTNRGELMEKGQTLGSPATYSQLRPPIDTRSTAFINITRPYVDAAAARVADMLLPTDELPFDVRPTPKSDMQFLMETVGRDAGFQRTQLGIAMAKEQEEGEQEKERAKAAYDQIRDWLVEDQWHGKGRQAIEDAARTGVGILKGPFPVSRRLSPHMRAVVEQLPSELRLQLLYRPGSSVTSCWNLYPSPDCGENIQDGSYVWERIPMSQKKLRKLADDESYFEDQISACLEEGPKDTDGKLKDPSGRNKTKKGYDVWLMSGMIPISAFGLLGEDASYEASSDSETHIMAQAFVCNERVIKVLQLPTDSQEFPYDVLVWQKVKDSWVGRGVARHINTPQRGLNAAARNMLDNAALSAGPQIVYWDGILEPQNGRFELRPRKLWKVKKTFSFESLSQVQNAITTINIPSMQAELMSIIEFFLKMAEQSTGISLLLQGLSSSSEETVGGLQLKTNAASNVLRRLARLFDDSITEPHVTRYYEWIKIYGPDAAKGDVQVDARGSSTLVERDLQTQALQQLLPMSKDPEYGVSPKKLMKQLLLGQRFDYETLAMDEEERQRIEQSMQQPDIKQVVAEIGAKSDVEVAKLRAQMDWMIEQLKAGLKREELAVEATSAAEDRAAKLEGEQRREGTKAEGEKLKLEEPQANATLKEIGFG